MSKYPQIKERVTGSFNTNSTQFLINLPASVEKGDMVIIFTAIPQSWAISITGWGNLSLQTGNNVYHSGCHYKINDNETTALVTTSVATILTYHLYVLSSTRINPYWETSPLTYPQPEPLSVPLDNYLIFSTSIKKVQDITQPLASEIPTGYTNQVSSWAKLNSTVLVTLASAIREVETNYVADNAWTYFNDNYQDAVVLFKKNNKITFGVMNSKKLSIDGDITKNNLILKG